MSEHTFDTPGPLDVYVELGAGSLTLAASDTTTTTIALTGAGADDTTVELDGGDLRVLAPKSSGFLGRNREVHARLGVPAGSRLAARCGSASVSATGPLARTGIDTGSGDITVAETGVDSLLGAGSGDVTVAHASGRLEVAVGSGDVRVDAAAAELLVKTGSGDVRVGEVAGDLVVRTGSGDADLGVVAGASKVRTGSGTLRLRRAGGDVEFASGSGDAVVEHLPQGALTARTASGDVRCDVPSGTPVWTDVSTVSGRIDNQLEQLGAPAEGQPHVEVRATTVSGGVVLRHV
ncbi:DUF4097 family beta strand repeat-containing protein [Nocardioides zeae]|uniref:DUF4097 family beta strand repeat-containing protein n=1 Tax=Nocardioides imazamoxiresistens TaxID=3231893 RepID=A0ABU3PVU9_9ACTN|nr:DUF4097 family beta strand repeat-containing protein [Nocardioides zeae]MDT9593357.1 DUF4097 family beta strand repeat-containing protein [Nocardioides zeae]